MRADSISNATVSRDQSSYDGIIPPCPQQQSVSSIHVFIHEFLDSSIFFSHICHSAPCVLCQCSFREPVFPRLADCWWKGQPSFSQQRMSLSVPHASQCVHKNLHSCGRKCQCPQSMMMRPFRFSSRLPYCRSSEKTFRQQHSK